MSYHDYGRFSRRHEDARPWFEEDRFDRGPGLGSSVRYQPVAEFSSSPRRAVDFPSSGYPGRYSSGSRFRGGQSSYRPREWDPRDEDPLNSSLDSLRFRLPPEDFYRSREPSERLHSLDRGFDDAEFEPRGSRFSSRAPFRFEEELDRRAPSRGGHDERRQTTASASRRVSQEPPPQVAAGHSSSASRRALQEPPQQTAAGHSSSASRRTSQEPPQQARTPVKVPRLQTEASSFKRTAPAPRLQLSQAAGDRRKARAQPPSKSSTQLQSEMIAGSVRDSGTRILTVSISQIRHISRSIDRVRPRPSVVYELHGRIGSIFAARLQLCSRFQISDLTSHSNCILDCVFYDIDDTEMMRNLHEGLACQCVGTFRAEQNEFQCLSVRPLFDNEMKLVRLLRMLTDEALKEIIAPRKREE